MLPDNHLNLSLKRTEPGLWVSRIVLFASTKPPQIIREILLHRGLNIVWGVDEGDPTGEQAIVAGHGVGKTSFCRLLRYCLGEHTFATKNTREQIRQTFPQGFVAAEVHIRGEKWAVARSIGKNNLYYAAKGITVEDLLENRPGSKSYDNFKDILEAAMLDDLVVGMTSGTKQPIKWEHLLAWCTRDQEARLQNIWEWRSTRSESEPISTKPKGDGLFVIRTVLGLLTEKEAELTEHLTELEKNIAETKEEIDERQKEPEYLCRHHNRKLKELLGIAPNEDILLESDSLFNLPFGVRVTNEQERLTKENDELDKKIIDIDKQTAKIPTEIAAIKRQLKIMDIKLKLDQGKLDKLKTGITNKQNEREKLEGFDIEECDLTGRPLKDCSYIQERIGTISFSAAADAKQIEEIAPQLEKAIQATQDNISRLNADTAELEQENKKLIEKRLKLQRQYGANDRLKQDLQSTLTELIFYTNLVNKTQPDTKLFDLQQRFNSLNEEKEKVQTQLSDLLKIHNEHLNILSHIFDDTVKETLSQNYKGRVTFNRGEIAFGITHGNTMAGEAIETLVILLADVSAMIMGMCGGGHHPSFLVHDSPREADLGAPIYSSFLRFIGKLHIFCGGSDKAPFQYIVTTTTPPPPVLQTEEFVRLKLNARNEADMLFCKNIGHIYPGDTDIRQLSLNNP